MVFALSWGFCSLSEIFSSIRVADGVVKYEGGVRWRCQRVVIIETVIFEELRQVHIMHFFANSSFDTQSNAKIKKSNNFLCSL